MKRTILFIVFSFSFFVSATSQTLSIARLIKDWNANDTSQTTKAEATYADLKYHINVQAFTARISELEKYLNEHPSSRLKVRVLMYKILGKQELNIPLTEADMDDIRHAITLAGLLNDPQFLSEVYTLYGERVNRESGLFYDLKAIEIQKRIGATHFPMLWMRYLTVSKTLSDYSQFRESIRFGKEGIRLIPLSANNIPNYVLLLDNIGASYWNLSEADSTLYYYRKIDNILSHYPVHDTTFLKIWEGIVKGGEGMALFLQKKYTEAIPLLEQNVASSDTLGQLGDAAKAENILAQISFIEKKDKSALGKWDTAWHWAMAANDLASEVTAVKGIRDIYRADGKYDSAYRYDEIFHQYRDIMDSEINNNRLAVVNTHIEYTNMRADLINDQAYIKHQKHIRDAIIAGIVAVTILLLLLFYSYNNKQRYRQEKHKHEQELAQLEIDRAKKQMDDFSKNISEKAKMIEELKTRIDGKVDESVLHSLRHFTILTEEDWQNFKETFGKIYPGYWERLDDKCPHLTLAEQRFMALSKLGLNNKEMAVATGVSPETIRVLTYRLRKKLSVPETNDLIEIAHSI